MKNNDQSDNQTIQYHKYFHVWKLWRDFMLKMGLSWFFSCLCHVKLSVHHRTEVCRSLSHIVCHIVIYPCQKNVYLEMNFIPKNSNKLGSNNRMFQQCPRYLCGIEFNHCDAASPKNISNSKIVYIVGQSGLMGSETQVIRWFSWRWDTHVVRYGTRYSTILYST